MACALQRARQVEPGRRTQRKMALELRGQTGIYCPSACDGYARYRVLLGGMHLLSPGAKAAARKGTVKQGGTTEAQLPSLSGIPACQGGGFFLSPARRFFPFVRKDERPYE